MDPREIVAIAAALILLAAAVGTRLWQRRTQRRGAEFEARVARFPTRRLSNDDRIRFAVAWRDLQAGFVDDLKGAVAAADRLVRDLLVARGYRLADFERRAADASDGHPAVLANYRAAREVARRNAAWRASTEDLRKALVNYRELFGELLAV